MKWALYNLLFLLAYPFLLPGFLFRMLRRGGYAARMGDRFALYPQGLFDKFGNDRPVWVHAVSVGEVQVAGQFMREWRKADPSVRFCMSTTSSTGWKAAGREVTERDVLVYNPLDFPNFVKSALRTVRPRAVVLTESELWPNFILRARRESIPLFLVNARVSDRSAPRYRAARWWFGDVLRAFSGIYAQSQIDKDRLVAAGADACKVEVTGSFKFDAARRNAEKERELRAWLGHAADGAKVLLGGSTWPGEDETMLRVFSRLVAAGRRIALVIAPRHFEKADAVEANIAKAGFACCRRSRGDSAPADASRTVFLADTTGELMGLYGICDVAFVGKSLHAHGSQNMIEPCLCGKPAVVGPYTENFRPVMEDLLAAGAIEQAADEEGVVAALERLLEDPGGLGERAVETVMRRKGVVARCVESARSAL